LSSSGEGTRDRTRVKICGVTRPEDAELAAELGADFVGLNFYSESPRLLGPSAAAEVADAVRGKCGLVGVFVNVALSEIGEIEAIVALELLQFHGDERPDELEPVAERSIKALRFDGTPDAAELNAYPGVWGFLVESRLVSRYGGAGKGWDYRGAANLPRKKPLLLAGGLRPDNVREAIAVSGAWGVDVCSGVEAAPGRKDPEKMKRFFDQVRGRQLK